MGKYRKKPVVITAWKWSGFGFGMIVTNDSGRQVIQRLPGLVEGDKACKECGNTLNEHGYVATRQGGVRICPGDWLIRGVEGEFYPCEPSAFEKTYEEVTGE